MREPPSSLHSGMVVVVGIPSDLNSSFVRGSAEAPGKIRQVLLSGSTNLCSEDGTDLGTDDRFLDLDDLELGTVSEIYSQIESTITGLLQRGAWVLSLGGDHAITLPILRAYSKKYGAMNVLQIDAHPDLYDEYEGSRFSHACTFARVMEEGLAKRLIQVGIRAGTPHQSEQAARFGAETVDMRSWRPGSTIEFDGPVYVSLDMDALDPGFAPGVSHLEPGGLSTRDVLQFVQGLDAEVVGADIVEFNPGRDPSGITAMAAVKFMKEMSACMLRGSTVGDRAGEKAQRS
jgi:arginase